jgi:RNA polymerase sigma-70 factor (ECF subfamily)
VFSLNPAFVELETLDSRTSLDRARAGDTEAFCDVCRTYETRLRRQAAALCGDAALAEDLAQDTLVEAWKCLRRYNGRCQFFTWLCAILLHRYRNTFRTRRPVPLSTLAGDDRNEFQNSLDTLAAQESLPDQAAELRDRAAVVRTCIQALSRKHQQVIYLRFFVDDSLEEIAAALGCSVGTVKSRLFHALDKLRAMNALNAQSENRRSKVGCL